MIAKYETTEVKPSRKIIMRSINLPFHLINSVLCQGIHIAKSNVKLVRGYKVKKKRLALLQELLSSLGSPLQEVVVYESLDHTESSFCLISIR